ncbi:MAG: sigma-54 dependent transcriptional regulator [Bryobacteraceae bacterium]
MIPVKYSPPQPDENRHVLVGHSSRTRHMRRMIDRMGKCRWPALLLGETGTGKEVVARAIHAQTQAQARATNAREPFVTIDCSSMVGPLMESELFGHVKGAFTGAASAKIGLIEAANGGTAFFDEIGELPLDLQAKLLRVLQEKEYRPVGSLTTRRSDFRIIAATNRDLAKEVEKGTFRRDLYFRLNVINMRLSPLRERKEDIPSLVNHFLSRADGNYSLTSETLEVILAYDWPGNIRELENCVQHMMAVNSGPLLHAADLPSALLNFVAQQKSQYMTMAAVASAEPVYMMDSPPLPKPPQSATHSGIPMTAMPNPGSIIPLMELERRAILHALDYTKGDRAIAAHLLGIGRTTLYRKLKEYEIAS